MKSDPWQYMKYSRILFCRYFTEATSTHNITSIMCLVELGRQLKKHTSSTVDTWSLCGDEKQFVPTLQKLELKQLQSLFRQHPEETCKLKRLIASTLSSTLPSMKKHAFLQHASMTSHESLKVHTCWLPMHAVHILLPNMLQKSLMLEIDF